MNDGVNTVSVTVGESERGLWCGACALPSVIAVPIQTLSKRGAGQFTVTRCTECGAGTQTP